MAQGSIVRPIVNLSLMCAVHHEFEAVVLVATIQMAWSRGHDLGFFRTQPDPLLRFVVQIVK